MNLVELYSESTILKQIADALEPRQVRLAVDGMSGSMPSVVVAALAGKIPTANQIVIAPSKEDAYYLAGDLEALLGQEAEREVLLFPTSYRKS